MAARPLKSRLEESFASIAPPLASVLKTEGIQSVWKSFLTEKRRVAALVSFCSK